MVPRFNDPFQLCIDIDCVAMFASPAMDLSGSARDALENRYPNSSDNFLDANR
jgi:hypothetical protein